MNLEFLSKKNIDSWSCEDINQLNSFVWIWLFLRDQFWTIKGRFYFQWAGPQDVVVPSGAKFYATQLNYYQIKSLHHEGTKKQTHLCTDSGNRLETLISHMAGCQYDCFVAPMWCYHIIANMLLHAAAPVTCSMHTVSLDSILHSKFPGTSNKDDTCIVANGCPLPTIPGTWPQIGWSSIWPNRLMKLGTLATTTHLKFNYSPWYQYLPKRKPDRLPTIIFQWLCQCWGW